MHQLCVPNQGLVWGGATRAPRGECRLLLLLCQGTVFFSKNTQIVSVHTATAVPPQLGCYPPHKYTLSLCLHSCFIRVFASCFSRCGDVELKHEKLLDANLMPGQVA